MTRRNWIALIIPSFSNYFVFSTSQNKSFTQLDVFLLILCFYRFFGWICGGIWGFSSAKSTTNQSFTLIARESTKVGTKRAGCGNKTIVYPALIGCFRREVTSPDHLDITSAHATASRLQALIIYTLRNRTL